MGKMRMGHDPRSKTKLGQGLIKAVKETVEAEQPVPAPIDTKEIEAKLQAMLESHKEEIQKLVEEKEPLLSIPSCSCDCKPKLYKDSKARKHTVLLRQELEDSRIQLDELLILKLQSMDKKIHDLDALATKVDISVDYLLEEKPQEKQVVKEVIVEKPVTDPKVWMAIGLAILLNIGFILLK